MISEERLRELALNTGDEFWAFARAVEREAYEAAAKVAENLPGFRINEREHFAAAIRALKKDEK